MPAPDPWLVLGLPPGSSLAEARAARRRLAKQLHPDLHGGAAERSAQMSLVNRALAQIEAGLPAAPAPYPPSWPSADGAAPARPPSVPASAPAAAAPAARSGSDPDSFSVELLPVEAFEALFLAAYGLGDILVADEPYLLELYLTEPRCFCRLTLVPEAGGSLVTVEVSAAGEPEDAPEPAAVIDVLVSELNSLVAW